MRIINYIFSVILILVNGFFIISKFISSFGWLSSGIVQGYFYIALPSVIGSITFTVIGVYFQLQKKEGSNILIFNSAAFLFAVSTLIMYYL